MTIEVTNDLIIWSIIAILLFVLIVYVAIRMATAPLRKESEKQSRLLGEIAANSGVDVDLVNKILND